MTVTYQRTLIMGVAVLALCCEVALAGCGSRGKKEVAFVEPKQEHSKAHARAGKAWRAMNGVELGLLSAGRLTLRGAGCCSSAPPRLHGLVRHPFSALPVYTELLVIGMIVYKRDSHTCMHSQKQTSWM